MKIKLAALVLTILLIVNLVLLGVGKISNSFFWMIIMVIGIISYFGFRKGKINK